MPKTLTASLVTQISGGPAANASRALEITAYDSIEVSIQGAADLASAASTVVDVQPTSDAGQVLFLSIHSSAYGQNFEYDVSGGQSNIALDGPHVFIGTGAMGLLGAVPEQLTFRNGLGVDNNATITILVGRQAAS